MKIIFAGTPDFAAIALAKLLTTAHEIVAVYTQPDRPAGRGRKLTPSAVKVLAQQHHLPLFQPLNFSAKTEEGLAARAQLAALDADVMVVAAYGLILPQAVLELPKYGCLNIHASILPRWRGAAPIQRAILAGDSVSGVTIMQMAQGLDTGDMLLTLTTAIDATTTARQLHDRLAMLGADALLQVLESEAHLQQYQTDRTQQDEQHTVYAEKISKAEAKIDWSQTAAQIDRHIRAFNPVPVAFCEAADGSPLRVWSAQLIPSHQSHHQQYQSSTVQAGKILAIDKNGITVQCGDGHALLLTALQWAGGKALNAAQIFQTQKLQCGQVL